ncbi:YceI family protein [Arachidicoccus sp.]|jgi:polyisoprenoid-binding protein YceI|uniref:YceI family protein n=1 Tax=Arachidicoccus sp. TaxID=1872624 RepID=UPI003D1F0700
MKILFIIFFIFISSAIFRNQVNAQEKERYAIANNYIITIDGSSNLHDWSETVSKVTGKSIVTKNKDGSIDVDSLYMIMDVHSIKSPAGKMMVTKTYNALKADYYPSITFSLELPLKMIEFNARGTIINTLGRLTIAGVTKQVKISGRIYETNHDIFILEGTLPVRLSDYNIQPPTAMLGILKVNNNITVLYKTPFKTIN